MTRARHRQFSLLEYCEKKAREEKTRSAGNGKNVKNVKAHQRTFPEPKIRKSDRSTLETQKDPTCPKTEKASETVETESFTPSLEEVISEKIEYEPPPVNSTPISAKEKNTQSPTRKKEQRSVHVKKKLLEKLEKTFPKPPDQKLKDFIESILKWALENFGNLQNGLHKGSDSKARP